MKQAFRRDIFGMLETLRDTTGMFSPVRCRCGQVYDMGTVTVTARYLDCSVWRAPCCNRQVDDRGPGWKSVPDYTPIGGEGSRGWDE
jgi:hypothetical protein